MDMINNRTNLENIISRRKANRLGDNKITKRDINSNICEASFAQQRLYFLNQFEKNSSAYNIGGTIILKGTLDYKMFKKSIEFISKRHESLRSTLTLIDSKVMQVIHEDISIPIKYEDLRNIEEDKRDKGAMKIINNEFSRPFDLSTGPLAKVILVQLEDGLYYMCLCMHHAVSDNKSIQIFMEELGIVYGQQISKSDMFLPELYIQYADFSQWQRSEGRVKIFDKQIEYWRDEFADVPDLLELPLDTRRPSVRSSLGNTLTTKRSLKIKRAINEISSGFNVSEYMIMLAAFQLFLYKHSGQKRFAVGTPVTARRQNETLGLIGVFADTMAVTANFEKDITFEELIIQVRDTVLNATTNSDVPFEKVVNSIHTNRSTSYTPLFQTMFVLHEEESMFELPNIEINVKEMEKNSAKCDITLTVISKDDGFEECWEYSTEIFEKRSIELFIRRFGTLLNSIIDNPSKSISEFQVMDEEELNDVLVKRNNTLVPYDLNKSLYDYIREQVSKNSNKVAIKFKDDTLTYGELDKLSNKFANKLIQQGIIKGDFVSICMYRSLALIVALLGTIKSGAVYVPIDPDYPKDRIDYLLKDSNSKILVFDEESRKVIDDSKANNIVLNKNWESILNYSEEKYSYEFDAFDNCYMIYTSGSTGQPKGAIIHHAAVVNRLMWMKDDYKLGKDDVFLQKTPFSFDVSVWELFLPFIVGAKLVIAEPEKHKDAKYLRNIIKSEKVSVVHFVPSMLEAFLSEENLEELTSLKNVFCSGEALPRKSVNKFYEVLKDAKLINLYGPTEAAVDVSAWECKTDVDTAVVPIGFPVANTKLYVVDSYLKPVPDGVAGELVIAGVQVGKGYHNKSKQNNERFLKDTLSENGLTMYKTGDLARFRKDGSIEYLGRNDNQVKLRGFRVELGEIEQAINQCRFVKKSVVKAVEHNGSKVIVSYITHTAVYENQLKETIKQSLEKNLPEYMIPSFFIFLEEFPLTPNGKLDTRRLPTVDESILEELSELKEASNDIEKILCKVFMEVLSLPKIGVNNNFFEIGGDSIKALQIVAKARESGVIFELSDIFKYKTIDKIAENSQLINLKYDELSQLQPFSLISEKDRQCLPEGAVDAYPLSILQQGMIYHSEYIKNISTYHDVFSYHVQAIPNFKVFRYAFYKVVDRHPLLRTIVNLSSYSEPIQIVFEKSNDLFGEDNDISKLSEQEQVDYINKFIDEERSRNFKLELEQLIRVFLIKRSEKSFQLTLSFHHAILDGWSIGKLLTEVLENYSDILEGNEIRNRAKLVTSYSCFIKKEIEARNDKGLVDFFQNYLKDLEVSELPYSKKIEGKSDEKEGMRVQPINISKENLNKLQKLAAELGVPLKTLLMTAHITAIGFACGTEDVVTGFVSHGRLEANDGENVLGLFLNSLPIRVKLENENYRDLILKVFENETNLVKGRRVPYADILSNCKKEKLFDAIFNFTNYQESSSKIDSLKNVKIVDQTYYEKTSFELMASFSLNTELNILSAFLRYHSEVYDADKMKLLANYYERIIKEIANNCENKFSSYLVLSEEEKDELLNKFNDTRFDYDLTHPLHYWFEEQVAKTPDLTALKFEDLTMSYLELNTKANKVANYLIENGLKPNDFIGISLNRSFEMFIGIYGILKAGGAYVPIDPTYPKGRIDYMVEDSKINLLLCDSASKSAFDSNLKTICIDSEWSVFESKDDTNPIIDIGKDDYAYMIYTSGSTGKPKGAINKHKSISNFILWLRDNFKLEKGDAVLHKTPFSFDVSLCEIFQPLVCGAKVVIAKPDGHKDTTYLMNLVKAENIKLIHFVPSMLNLFLEEPKIEELNSLKYVICIGEMLNKEVEKDLYSKLDCQLSNLYGPAETAVVVTAWKCEKKDNYAFVPIGKPVSNTQIYIVDSMLNPVPKGVVGEILIGGVQVGGGYFNRDELTSQRFINDIFLNSDNKIYRTGDLGRYTDDGQIDFIGRMDHQVKINGLRIELGEIEESLRSHEGVKEAIVSVYKNNIGLDSLGAYVWVREEYVSTIQEQELIDYISNALPTYMIPSQILILDKFPLNPSGKVDRKKLPEFSPFKAIISVEMIKPQNALEEAIHDIICEVLGVEEISVIANLMDYGMGSLSAIRIVSKLRNTIGIDVDLAMIFDLKSITNISNSLLEACMDEAAMSELDKI